jgi:hypothetical protein
MPAIICRRRNPASAQFLYPVLLEVFVNTVAWWQLLTVLAIPMFGIFLGILLNQRSADKLSGKIKDVRDEIKDIKGELLDFRKQMQEEYIGLLNMISDQGQRIVRLEERGSRSS